MLAKTAKCERTGKVIKLSEGYYDCDTRTGEWMFVCKEKANEQMHYSIPVEDFTKSPETFVDWMGHLQEKTWFNNDKFCKFFTDFRSNNDLFVNI